MAASRRQALLRDRLLGLLTPAVEGAGYDLEDVAVSSAGKRSLVRVVVDADGGIDLDAVAEISRTVSDVLDENDDALPGAYVLEVTSPGVDRPLTQRRHWRRAVGRLVNVTVDGEPVTGRVSAVSDAGVALTVDEQRREAPWTALGPGRIQVEFARASDHADEPDEPEEPDHPDEPDEED